MTSTLRSVIVTVLLAATAGLFAGCQEQNMSAWEKENRALRVKLDSAEAARLAAENEKARLLEQVKSVPATPTEPLAPPTGAAVANTGAFAGIPGVETEARGGNIYVRIPGDVLFDSGKAVLKPTSKKTLDLIAAVLNKDYAGKTVRVDGYTDTDPIRHSNWTDNLELSMHRAAAVLRYIETKGVDAQRLFVAGFGANQPRHTKALSRRVEIVVVGGE